MSKNEANRCPGCSRHCRAEHVRCKYGQKYFLKMQASQESEPEGGRKTDKKRRRKWEKHVRQGASLWKLLSAGSRIKRALRKKKTTEAQLMQALSREEQAQLDALLDKLCLSLSQDE